MNELSVGDRLKALRKARGLSQRKLASRAGVANATISQIEAGSMNPTVGALKKILDGFPVSLAVFFGEEPDAVAEKIFFRASELTELSDGGVSYQQIGGALLGKSIQMILERYRPGATTGRHKLRHEGEECGIILKGELTVTVGDRTRTLAPGDAYYFKSDQPHSFRNDGPETCELISACTPPSF